MSRRCGKNSANAESETTKNDARQKAVPFPSPRCYRTTTGMSITFAHTGLYVSMNLSIPEEFHSRSLVPFCIRQFKKLADFVEWQTMLID